jgi:hypothetical protein
MPFFNLNIMPDPPSDPLVNVVTQLNNNWDVIDLGFQSMQGQVPGLPPNPDIGQQYSGGGANVVWTGSTWKSPVNWTDGWTAWTTLSGYNQAEAPFVNNTTYPVQYRNNTSLRQIEMRGGLQLGSLGLGWDNQTRNLSPMTVGIPVAFAPVDDKAFLPTAMNLMTNSDSAAYSSSANVIVEKKVNPNVWFRVKHTGSNNTGELFNIFYFDNVRWFY